MNNNYEGSVAELGTEDWSEPFDVVAPTPEIAAQKVLKQDIKDREDFIGSEIAHEIQSVCVREITPAGKPLSDWFYFKGSVKRVYQATVEAIKPE